MAAEPENKELPVRASQQLALVLAFATFATSAATAQTFPAGFVPVELKRWMRDDTIWDITTAPPNTYAPPLHDRGHLGWISTTQFPGSHALYVCARKSSGDWFTSTSGECESAGTRVAVPYVLGYIASSQIAGTVPLYRCLAGRNEFDSLDVNCEGFQRIGPLGYIFP